MTSSALRPIHVKDFFVSSHHADDQTFTRVHPFQDDLGPAASVAAQIQDHGLPGWIWIASLGNLLLETQWILRICHKKKLTRVLKSSCPMKFCRIFLTSFCCSDFRLSRLQGGPCENGESHVELFQLERGPRPVALQWHSS